MLTYKVIIVGLLSLSFISTSCQRAVRIYDRSVQKSYAKCGFESKKLETNEFTIQYFDNELQNKPVLLLLHGFGGDGKVTWERQIKDFSKDYRVIVPDLLWFGESFSTQSPSLQTQVNGMRLLLDKLHVSNVHLIGISYGGFVALSFASEHEDLLNSLTIVSSPGNVIDDQEIAAFCAKNEVADVKEIFVPKDAQAVKRLFDISMVKPPKLPTVLYQAIFEKYFSVYPIEQEQLLDNLPSNKDKIKTDLSIPTFIMWGAKDEIFNVGNAYKLQELLSSELVVHPTTGHTYPGEEPKHFNTELLKFIESVESTTQPN